ncbi:hypothetical protein THAOC_06280, partial [Thalassiosira oceanica]
MATSTTIALTRAHVYVTYISLGFRCFRVPKAESTKPNASKHGKLDHMAMANIGWRCTMEVAEGCIPDQNRSLVPILVSAKAVDPAIIDDFGLEVECRSTPLNAAQRRSTTRRDGHL